MPKLPHALRRPSLLLRDLVADRRRPDLARLGAIRDPERFVWAILPHAARSFSPCIALLPAKTALAAAVGYLYCRMLDTYEDLEGDPAARDVALAGFADRLVLAPPPAAPRLARPLAADERDRAHLLLVERCPLVDRVYAGLPAGQRALVGGVVRDMAEAMRWSARVFAAQGGVLADQQQLTRYCHGVMGHPVRFALRLAHPEPLGPHQDADALAVGEYVQLANISRDLEKDLARGVAYRPELRADLGRDAAADPAVAARVRAVRRALLGRALELAPAYRRLVAGLRFPRWSFARGAAVLMQLFTDRYYSACARRAGLPGWRRPSGSGGLLLRALPSLVSRGAARLTLVRIERDLRRAAAGLSGSPASAGPTG